MTIALRFLPFFIGLGVAFVVASKISHLDKTLKLIIIAICTLCLGYLFTWLNIRMMRRTGELSEDNVLSPNPLGHVSLVIGAIAIGYGFSVKGQVLLIVGFAFMWLADDLLTKKCSATSSQGKQQNHWLHKCMFALLYMFIRGTQKSIGIVSYRLTPDKNGMVSAGDLMRQPRTFEFHVAHKYNFNEKRTHGSHIVISKSNYKVIQYSSDPREGTESRAFTSPVEVARYVATLQIMTATNQALSQDEAFSSLNPKESYEQLKKQVDLIQEHKLRQANKIEKYLGSIKARLFNRLIDALSKLA